MAIPRNVTNIAYGAFAFSGLTFVEIPAAVRTVDDCVFWGCPDLLLVYLGSGVESVGAEAFADCSALWLQGDLDGGCDAPAFWNLTIVDNGGGTPVELHDNAVLGNTIVWGNTDNGISLHDDAEVMTCWTSDPGFVETAESGERDVHLRADSPCIGAGTVILPMMADAYDIDGQARIVQTSTGDQVDIGADAAAMDAVSGPTADSPFGVWRVVPGSLVKLQSCDSLDGGDNWQDVGEPFTVQGDTWSKEGTPDASGARFYRLLWVR